MQPKVAGISDTKNLGAELQQQQRQQTGDRAARLVTGGRSMFPLGPRVSEESLGSYGGRLQYRAHFLTY